MARFLALYCLALLVSDAGAQAPSPSKKINVTLVVILAREEGNEVDYRLKAIADEVRLKFPNLKSFRLERMTIRPLAPDEKAVIPTVDTKDVVITLKHGVDTEKWVGLAVTAPDQGEIVYRCVCGKFLPIVTRYQTRARELLILAISVQTCQEP